MTAQPMLILDTFTIKGRGLVIVGYPQREVHRGERVTLPDGRAWTVAGVERRGMRVWRPEDGEAVLLAGPVLPLPVVGETVTIEAVEASQR